MECLNLAPGRCTKGAQGRESAGKCDLAKHRSSRATEGSSSVVGDISYIWSENAHCSTQQRKQ